jgi:hypothetical protein
MPELPIALYLHKLVCKMGVRNIKACSCNVGGRAVVFAMDGEGVEDNMRWYAVYNETRTRRNGSLRWCLHCGY